ncbi:taste receptor type 2 member 50-like [Aquarana catesbeiana]|uniref:taste receptor type 2 member 50-like n=1 Tax=Aquarana catesbeiana TaxID=8400 RepID=UPI003CC98056
MANSTEKIYYEILEQYLFPFALLVILVLAGLVIQSFIVTVNIIDWMKGRLITGADKIITSIGISRIFFHAAFLLNLFLFAYLSNITIIFSIFIFCALESLNFSNIWLSALLSIFFYFKISTSHNVFILRLKVIMSKRIIYLIIATFILSLGYTSMNGLLIFHIFFRNSTQAYTSVIMQQIEMLDYFKSLWNLLPLLMSFITSVLLIILLGLHTSRLNNHGHADTYCRTITFTVFSFLACGLYTILNVVHVYMRLLGVFWWYFITNVFPVLHSILLIYVATKLRNQFFRIVHCGTDYLFNRNTPGSRSRGPEQETPL